jgi:hypothetical protein
MKLFQIDRAARTLKELRDLGNLRPFSEISLMVQILKAAEEMADNSKAILFSHADEQQIVELSERVLGSLEMHSDHGPGRHGAKLLVERLLCKRPDLLVCEGQEAKGRVHMIAIRRQ